jgi:MFS family permease
MDGAENSKDAIRRSGIGEPLQVPLFRRIWLASLFSNLGLFIQAVGAAWIMTQLTPAADMVALVQTALMLPIMLLAVAAGAVADMYDRRKVGLWALSMSLVSALSLCAITASGYLTPWLLLGFCFLIGTGMALFGPAWQASVAEQVPQQILPQAIALNSISYNIARSFGPAIGGIVVATGGAVAAFAMNSLLYVPLLIIFLLWRREPVPSRLPPERLNRAIASGIRYVVHSPAICVVLSRTFATGIAGGSVSALMPLVAKDILGGGARTYGMILGAFGIGAVIGALNIAKVRKLANDEKVISACALSMALAILTVAISEYAILTAIVLLIAGGAWMVSVTLFNVVIQLSSPRWVSGRMLASFQAAIAGGVAVGSWLWGHLAQDYSVSTALMASAFALGLLPLLGLWFRMPVVLAANASAIQLEAPDTALALTARSGPIVVMVEYRIDPSQARIFYGLMQNVQLSRQRNGAYAWSIARDIKDPALWIERFHTPTWFDYLRHRSRHTAQEQETHRAAEALHCGSTPILIRHLLERPFGSVRWRDDAPDAGNLEVLPIIAS